MLSSPSELIRFDNFYLSLMVFMSLAIYCFNTYIDYRQYRKLNKDRRPRQIEKLIGDEEFQKSRLYSLDKARYGFVVGLIGLIDLVLMVWGYYPKVWLYASSYLNANASEIKKTLLFVTIINLISKVQSIPLEIYYTFCIEKRHGFNKKTPWLFVTDTIKGIVLTGLFGLPFISVLVYMIRHFGENFYFAVWLFVFLFQLFMILLYPTFIQPLFNKFDPLPDGSLKEKIQNLAKKLAFPLERIFIMDGSKRSSHSNAYFFGFFSKRIVLFDTLLEHSSEDEICAILSHELGHWKRWHAIQTLIFSQIHIFALFYGFSRFIGREKIYQSFGITFGEYPIIIGLLLFLGFVGPIEILVSFMINCLSRKNEFEADKFAVDLGYGQLLKSALIKLQVENKGNMNPDWIYSAVHYSHPPLVERLTAIDENLKKQK